MRGELEALRELARWPRGRTNSGEKTEFPKESEEEVVSTEDRGGRGVVTGLGSVKMSLKARIVEEKRLLNRSSFVKALEIVFNVGKSPLRVLPEIDLVVAVSGLLFCLTTLIRLRGFLENLTAF